MRYELVLAARHPAAYELWNDEVARGDTVILDGDDAKALEARLADAKALLREAVRARPRFGRDEVIRELAVAVCGEGHSRLYRSAVAELLKDGEWQWVGAPAPIATAPMRKRG